MIKINYASQYLAFALFLGSVTNNNNNAMDFKQLDKKDCALFGIFSLLASYNFYQWYKNRGKETVDIDNKTQIVVEKSVLEPITSLAKKLANDIKEKKIESLQQLPAVQKVALSSKFSLNLGESVDLLFNSNLNLEFSVGKDQDKTELLKKSVN